MSLIPDPTRLEAQANAAPPLVPAPLRHYFPLRPTYLAELELPCDLNQQEAERLCAFIHALVTDESKDDDKLIS